MDSIMKKITDQFQTIIDDYVQEYAMICDDFSDYDDDNKAAAGYELSDMVTGNMREEFATWSHNMHEQYLAYNQLARLDDESADIDEYKKFIDWPVVDSYIITILQS
jgi:hypothetical protein